MTKIDDEAFSNCKGFNQTLELPMYIRTIGKYAFFNCWRFIGNLITPDKVTVFVIVMDSTEL